MATRLVNVVIDSADPGKLAQWWATALSWQIVPLEDERDVMPPPGEPGVTLTFVPVQDARVTKNRIHLDLASQNADDHLAIVGRLIAAGARRIDIGQDAGPAGPPPWVVMADPEGNEFCVLEPRPAFQGIGAIAGIVVDCQDPALMGSFWEQASGWTNALSRDDLACLRAPDGTGPLLAFVQTGEPHSVKNRVHLDVAPFADDDQAAEVKRLLNAGAVRAEVGQSKLDSCTWVVLTDPENNEFCVLSAR